MLVILIDSCVISDLGSEENDWFEWSVSTLDDLDKSHALIINPIIYAEVSVAYERIEAYEEFINYLDFAMQALPKEALFLAGTVFYKYRKRQVDKENVLPDFFIGAHAAVSGYMLMTRDKARFTNYFPTVKLIKPTH